MHDVLTLFYAKYLFAVYIHLLYGKQGNVLVVSSPEFLPRATEEGYVPLHRLQFRIQKSTWLLPSLGQHVRTTHFVYIK